MAELISAGDFATEGERRAAEHLRKLPDRWIVICNKTFPTREGRSYEIDFIILASRWIFVLDEKSWQGKITGTDQEWLRADGSSERSPLNKIEAVARRPCRTSPRLCSCTTGTQPICPQWHSPLVWKSAPRHPQ